MEGVQKVNFEEEPPSDMVSVERDSFHQGDVRHKRCPPVIRISAKADRQSVID